MRPVSMKSVSVATAAAILFAPTAAAASSVQSSAPPANAWVTLSQMNPAGATALAGSGAAATSPNAVSLAGAATAAQPVDDPGAPRANPLPLPVIAVLLLVLATAIYIAFIDDHDGDRVFLISPQ